MDPDDLGDRTPASCLEEALETFGRAVEQDPESGEAWAANAHALLLARRPDEALTSARRAVTVAPRASASWVALGRTQLALGLIADARASAAMALTPGSGVTTGAFDLRHEIAAAAGDEDTMIDVPAEALLEMSAHLSMSPEADAEGRFDDALAEVDARLAAREYPALLMRGRACELLVRRGRILLAWSRRLQTLSDVSAQVNEAPGDPRTWAAVATALRALGRREESISALRRCVQLDPTATYGWMSLGLLLDELDRPAEALEAFDAARRLDPGCSDYWVHSAEMLVRLGRERDAAPLFRRAMELEPATPEPPADR